jgi:hypothetical protein
MPPPNPPSRPATWSSSLLRRDLSARAHHLARTQNLLHDISPGSPPVIIFGRDEQGRHGNFHPASDTAICANPAWLRRLSKPHTASRRSRARKDWQWMELDSANSSDALLMNIFCHPGVFNGHTLAPAVANLLNVEPLTQPCFGINPGVPLRHPRKGRSKLPLELTDRTEIDLRLGDLFLEAKLTESNFQTAAPRLIERYRDLETVFDPTRLPRKILYTPPSHPSVEDCSQLEPEFEADTVTPNETPIANAVIDGVILSKAKNPRISTEPQPTSFLAKANLNQPLSPSSSRTLIQGYQLIRNVLAAFASDAFFCVLCDARRRDLIEIWYGVLSAVHSPTFATRLKLLTWQELSTTLPKDLQQFLEAKYGILPAKPHSYPNR